MNIKMKHHKDQEWKGEIIDHLIIISCDGQTSFLSFNKNDDLGDVLDFLTKVINEMNGKEE